MQKLHEELIPGADTGGQNSHVRCTLIHEYFINDKGDYVHRVFREFYDDSINKRWRVLSSENDVGYFDLPNEARRKIKEMGIL